MPPPPILSSDNKSSLIGAAYGVINTVADSFASQVYEKDIDEVVAVMEGVAGVGMIVSPVIGIYVY